MSATSKHYKTIYSLNILVAYMISGFITYYMVLPSRFVCSVIFWLISFDQSLTKSKLDATHSEMEFRSNFEILKLSLQLDPQFQIRIRCFYFRKRKKNFCVLITSTELFVLDVDTQQELLQRAQSLRIEYE